MGDMFDDGLVLSSSEGPADGCRVRVTDGITVGDDKGDELDSQFGNGEGFDNGFMVGISVSTADGIKGLGEGTIGVRVVGGGEGK